MKDLAGILAAARRGDGLGADELEFLLGLQDPGEVAALHAAAYAVKEENVGRVVYLRGLVEISNLCEKDCLYCGIRRSNSAVRRFRLDAETIVAGARQAHEARHGSLVLQGGEVQSPAHTAFIEDVLRRIHRETGGELAITLSLGEQDRDTYARWREAGAHRYLLRLETSDPLLYAQLHPPDHLWQRRLDCLHRLRETGYQVGTGVMCGLPGQTLAGLAGDLLFLRNLDVDMVGMGPYIPHRDTPLAQELDRFDPDRALELGLKMLACLRLLMPDINMAATTALQALAPRGRERGLMAGANVIMPNVTDPAVRPSYELYEGKPGLDENSATSREELARSIASLGETIGYGRPGTSPRYLRRRTGHPTRTKSDHPGVF